MPERPIKVMHIMTRLVVGGAQETALATCAFADPEVCAHTLVVGPQTGAEGSLFDEARRLGVRVLVAPRLRREIAPLRDARTVIDLVRLIRSESPDIVHSHSSKAGIVARVAARLAGTPTVVASVHGWSFNDHMPIPVRRGVVAMERLLGRSTDWFVVEHADDLGKGVAERVGSPSQYVTVRNGVDLEQFDHHLEADAGRRIRATLGISADAPVVGSVIRFTEQKNPQALVRVAQQICTQEPRCTVLLVGDGPLRPEAESLARTLGVSDRVRFLGVRRDIPDLLAAMDLFLLASRWEGLPRVVLEAMATQVPVVAPRINGMAEAVEDKQSGLLTPPGDERALASAVLDLLQDAPRRRAFQERGRLKVEEDFNVRRMAQDLQHFYQAAVSGSVPAARAPR